MKGYIYTIPHPRRLLEILAHSGGGGGRGGTKKGLCSSAAGPLWLTAEHQPPTSCSACVIPAVQLREGFVSSCHPVCRCNLLPTVTSTGILKPFTQDSFFFFFFQILPPLNWVPFSSHNAEVGESVVIHPNSHSERTAFSLAQHLHHSQTEAQLLSPCISPDVMGKLITSLVSLIYLSIGLLASSPKSSHLVPKYGLRLYSADETKCQYLFFLWIEQSV